MLDMETICAAAARLAAAASSPSRVIVFGSYARGTAEEGSDLDLMVVERELTDYCSRRAWKARCCMTPFIEEAERQLRLARRDYQTFMILRSHPEAQRSVPTPEHYLPLLPFLGALQDDDDNQFSR